VGKKRLLKKRIIALVISLVIWGLFCWRLFQGKLDGSFTETNFIIMMVLFVPLLLTGSFVSKNKSVILIGEKKFRQFQKYRIIYFCIFACLSLFVFFISKTVTPQYVLYILCPFYVMGESVFFFFENRPFK